jgi:hypothetical protein
MQKIKSYIQAPWLLPLLLLSLPFERIPSFQVFDVTIRISLLLGLALIAQSFILRRQQMFTLIRKVWPAWVLLFATLLSALAAVHLPRALVVFGFYSFVVLLALAVVSAFSTKHLELYAKMFIFGAIATSLFAIYQFFGDLFDLPTYLTGLRPDYTKMVFGYPRIQAAALEPLYFVNLLLLPLALILMRDLYTKKTDKLSWLIYTCAFLAVSRGGIVAVLVITILALVAGLWRRSYSFAARTVGMLVFGFAISYSIINVITPQIAKWRAPVDRNPEVTTLKSIDAPETYQRQATNYEIGDTNSERAITRRLAVDAFKTSPVLGLGPGGFGYYAHDHVERYTTRQTVNNLPLEILAELGVVGALAVTLFALYLLRALWQLFKVSQPEVRLWATAFLLFLVALAVQYQTFSTLYIIHIWVAIGLLLGLSRAKSKL